MTPGQRFDALIFAALDVSDTGQADVICRAFPALWAQWAQDPARAQDTGQPWAGHAARMAQVVAEGEIIDARPDLGSVPLSPPATGSCTASSWRGQSRQGKQPYGPGGYNRCVLTAPHEIHQDDFGNRFILEPKFRILNAAGTPKAGRS